MNSKVSLTVVFFVLLLSFSKGQAAGNKELNGFKEWIDLHKVYMDALSKLRPESKSAKIEFTEKDYDLLLNNLEMRLEYLDYIDALVEDCSQHPEILECEVLQKRASQTDMAQCLGGVGDSFTSDSIDQLGLELDKVFLAQTRADASAYKKYSSSSNVQNMIATLRKNLNKVCSAAGCKGKRRVGSTGKCLRYVKIGVRGGGFTKGYAGTLHARDYCPELTKIGFKNVITTGFTARSAPVGAILVYTGGKSGHIEVKAGSDEYLSDFKETRPIDEYLGRRLIGVYVK